MLMIINETSRKYLNYLNNIFPFLASHPCVLKFEMTVLVLLKPGFLVLVDLSIQILKELQFLQLRFYNNMILIKGQLM